MLYFDEMLQVFENYGDTTTVTDMLAQVLSPSGLGIIILAMMFALMLAIGAGILVTVVFLVIIDRQQREIKSLIRGDGDPTVPLLMKSKE